MKALAASAFAIALAGGPLLEAQAQDGARHSDIGIFTLNLGEAADLTGDHIPLEFVQVWAHPLQTGPSTYRWAENPIPLASAPASI